ncbi:hypothetical protein [Caulobacter segnis]
MTEETSERTKRLHQLRNSRQREEERIRQTRLVLVALIAMATASLMIVTLISVSDSSLAKALTSESFSDIVPKFVAGVGTLFIITFFVLFSASRNSGEDHISAVTRVAGLMADGLIKAVSAGSTASLSARTTERALATTRALAEAKKREAQDFMRRPTDYIDILTQFRLRMRGEEKRLKINSVINLMWGIFFSLLSGGWLLYSVTDLKNHTSYPNMVDMIAAYAPRSALAIILQLVGFFFLRLYASTEHEIKHHKNEITNMESRFAGAMLDAGNSTPPTRAIIMKSFMTVERNFLIKKGERTAATDVDTRYNDLAAMLEIIVQGIGDKPAPKPRTRRSTD